MGGAEGVWEDLNKKFVLINGGGEYCFALIKKNMIFKAKKIVFSLALNWRVIHLFHALSKNFCAMHNFTPFWSKLQAPFLYICMQALKCRIFKVLYVTSTKYLWTFQTFVSRGLKSIFPINRVLFSVLSRKFGVASFHTI